MTYLTQGKSYTLTNIQPSHSGEYHCRARNGISTAWSRVVQLDVQYAPVNVRVEVSPPGSLAEGSSVNLTCSSEANPAVDSYTWYRRTGPPNSSSLVGPGQVLFLASLDPSQTGHYLCQASNSLGEDNSTLVEGEMEDEIEIHHGLILHVLIGVKALAVLILPLVMVWAW
ncbi:B-cell receptor CD22-like [Aplochiton taeniatus]